eukprot:11181726-Lingulodinium_polyedra.AAC.1
MGQTVRIPRPGLCLHATQEAMGVWESRHLPGGAREDGGWRQIATQREPVPGVFGRVADLDVL